MAKPSKTVHDQEDLRDWHNKRYAALARMGTIRSSSSSFLERMTRGELQALRADMIVLNELISELTLIVIRRNAYLEDGGKDADLK